MTWTLNNVGNSEGPSSGDHHKVDGQMDFTPVWGTDDSFRPGPNDARQDVPYEHNFNKISEVPHVWDRAEIADAQLSGQIPQPFGGSAGTPIDFGGVAPDHMTPRPSPGNGWALTPGID